MDKMLWHFDDLRLRASALKRAMPHNSDVRHMETEPPRSDRCSHLGDKGRKERGRWCRGHQREERKALLHPHCTAKAAGPERPGSFWDVGGELAARGSGRMQVFLTSSAFCMAPIPVKSDEEERPGNWRTALLKHRFAFSTPNTWMTFFEVRNGYH